MRTLPFQEKILTMSIVKKTESSLDIEAAYAVVLKYIKPDGICAHKWVIKILNMAPGSSNNFRYNDDFDAAMAVIEAGILQNDKELNLGIHSRIKNVHPKKNQLSDVICFISFAYQALV